MTKLTHAVLHIRAMGRDVRVTAVFTQEAEANAHMERHPPDGVIAVEGSIIFLADVRDLGMPRRFHSTLPVAQKSVL